jgi:hypothetical protein
MISPNTRSDCTCIRRPGRCSDAGAKDPGWFLASHHCRCRPAAQQVNSWQIAPYYGFFLSAAKDIWARSRNTGEFSPTAIINTHQHDDHLDGILTLVANCAQVGKPGGLGDNIKFYMPNCTNDGAKAAVNHVLDLFIRDLGLKVSLGANVIDDQLLIHDRMEVVRSNDDTYDDDSRSLVHTSHWLPGRLGYPVMIAKDLGQLARSSDADWEEGWPNLNHNSILL